MRLYKGYVLVRDLVSAYKGPLPANVNQIIDESNVWFGNLKCVKVSKLYGEAKKVSESCRKLDCLYPPSRLSIELGFSPEYFVQKIVGRRKRRLSIQQSAIVLTNKFLALVQKGFIPYRFERDSYYIHVIDFYGVKIGFYHPSLLDHVEDLSYLPKPFTLDAHSTGIRGVVIYHSNREIGRSVGFQSLWMEKGKEKSRAFSIQKYGFREAFKLAVNERCKRIGIGEIGRNCRLDFATVESRLKQMGLGSYINMKPATKEESRSRRAQSIRVNNNTGVDGVMLTTKKEKGVVYLIFRSRCLIDGKEFSMSCSVKNIGFVNAAREAVLWRMRRTGRAEFFSESLLCKKRIREWIMRNDEVRFAAIGLNDEWLKGVLAEVDPDCRISIGHTSA